MTATTVVREAAVPRKRTKARLWRCQFCVTGHHGSCPGAVWQHRKVSTGPKEQDYRIEPVLWRCECTGQGHPQFPYCTECKNDHPDEINSETWRCFDQHVCAGRLKARRDNSELWQMLQRVKSRSALARRAKRMGFEDLLAGIDPFEDEKIDRVQGYLDRLEDAKRTSKPKGSFRKPSPPKPKTGKCECCGESTRGGRFLPGHDAKLASALKIRVKAGDAEAYEELKRRNWLGKLPAKYREGV